MSDRYARVEIYEDAAGKFRWRRVSGNGQTTDGPQQGYTRREKAIEAALKRNLDVRHERFLDFTTGRDGVPLVSVWVDRLLGPRAP